MLVETRLGGSRRAGRGAAGLEEARPRAVIEAGFPLPQHSVQREGRETFPEFKLQNSCRIPKLERIFSQVDICSTSEKPAC